MKRYPYQHQENSNDCGVACLEMVIRYYKGKVPKTMLQLFTHTNKSGTTAYHMVETLKQLGFQATGVSYDLESSEKIVLPCIAHVIFNQSYYHYVVIYEIDKKKRTILIADPASGLKRMKIEEFKQIYNHILIILYPLQKIPYYQKDISFIIYTLKTIQMNWKYFIPLCLLSIFVFILSLFGTFYIQLLFHIDFSKIYYFIYFIFFLELLKHTLSYIRNILLEHLHQKLGLLFTRDAFFKIMNLPYLQYHNLPTGDFMARLQDIHMIQETVASFAFTLLFDGFLFLLSACFLFYLQPTLFFIILILSASYVILMLHFRKVHKKNLFLLEQENVNVQTFMTDYMHSFEMVKGLSITNKVISKFEVQYQKYTSLLFQFQKKVYLENLECSWLESIGMICFLTVGIYLYRNGIIAVGMVFTYQLLFSYVMGPVIQFVDSDNFIQRAKRALERLEQFATMKTRDGKKEIITSISCKQLNYAYDEKIILENINLEWSGGKKILCMGTSGSGKSTLFKCIKGHLESQQIFINGDKKEYFDSSIENQILYVSQNETLILGSVLDNVLMLDESSEVESIMSLCEVDRIVQKDPLKYHMLVEENGSNFSGGERAQIVLARTLLKPFEVLLIDEGFGQMDPNLERRILKRMFEKFPNKIIAIISHRKDNMDLYDQVIEMSNGKIVKVLERSVSI